jgi:uncharacterized protein (UPF0276 family)
VIERAVALAFARGLEPIVRTPGLVDAIEIEPETFALDPRDWAAVCALPQPKVIHAVGHAPGGSLPVPAADARWLADRVRETGAEWASHHLAVNWFGAGRFASFFLPPRQTAAGVAAAARSIRALARQLPVPFAVETGVSYLRPREDELPDGAFAGAVAEAADCGLLLDLHNVWTNARNGRQPVAAYLAQLPLDRVIEVHVAGGMELDGFWLDAHAGAPPPEVLALLDDTLPRLPRCRAITFEVLDGFIPRMGLDAIGATLERLRRAWDRPRAPVSIAVSQSVPEDTHGPDDVVAWESALGALVLGASPLATTASIELAAALADDPGVALYAKLVEQARASALVIASPFATRVLVLALGVTEATALFARFWGVVDPSPTFTGEADRFADWLAATGLAVPNLADALVIDAASRRATEAGATIEYELVPVLAQ